MKISVLLFLLLGGCVHSVPSKYNSSVYFTGPETCTDLSAGPKKEKCLWFREVGEIVAGKWAYPEEAGKQSLEGVVELELKVDRSGNLIKTTIIKSSGHKLLDENSVSSFAAAAPFPKPNFDLKNEDTVITVKQTYKLK